MSSCISRVARPLALTTAPSLAVTPPLHPIPSPSVPSRIYFVLFSLRFCSPLHPTRSSSRRPFAANSSLDDSRAPARREPIRGDPRASRTLARPLVAPTGRPDWSAAVFGPTGRPDWSARLANRLAPFASQAAAASTKCRYSPAGQDTRPSHERPSPDSRWRKSEARKASTAAARRRRLHRVRQSAKTRVGDARTRPRNASHSLSPSLS